jgi:hypothetical protein
MKKTKTFTAVLFAVAIILASCIPAQSIKASDSALPTATNISFEKARELSFDTSIAEETSGSDNLRYYKFSLSSASELILRGTRTYRYEIHFYIYDEDLTEVYHCGSSAYGSTDYSLSTYLTGGNYYLKITSGASLSFTASKNALKETLTETQTKNNDLTTSAYSINLQKKYKGVLAANDEIDFFKFNVPAKGNININVLNSTDNTMKIVVYDKNLNMVGSNTLSSGKSTVGTLTLASGNYYIAFTQNNSRYGVGSYTFTLDYSVSAPKAPTLRSVKNLSGKKLSIKWKKVSGASGYELQYATNKKFKSGLVKKTLSKNKTSATYKKMKKGKTYYVRMRSYIKYNGKKVYSKYSAVKSVKIKK